MAEDLTWKTEGFSPGQDRGRQANGGDGRGTKRARVDNDPNVLKNKDAEETPSGVGGRSEPV
jgi:hypothetical protein